MQNADSNFDLVIATILDLGNQIWQNMGNDELIDDPGVFFR